MTKKQECRPRVRKYFKTGGEFCVKIRVVSPQKNTARRADLRRFSRSVSQRRLKVVFNTDKTLPACGQTDWICPLKFSTAYPLSAFFLRGGRGVLAMT